MKKKYFLKMKMCLYFWSNSRHWDIIYFGDHCNMIANAGRSWEAKIWSCYYDYSQCWFLLQVHGGLHQPPGDARGQEQVYYCLGHIDVLIRLSGATDMLKHTGPKHTGLKHTGPKHKNKQTEITSLQNCILAYIWHGDAK